MEKIVKYGEWLLETSGGVTLLIEPYESLQYVLAFIKTFVFVS
jgi:hypothetical protein